MARHGVTYLDVANAAEQIIASGKSLTIENLRTILEQLFSNSKIEIATLTEKLSGLTQQLHEKEARNEEYTRSKLLVVWFERDKCNKDI